MCIPPAMTALKSREKLSTVFGFHEKLIMPLSMHQVASIGDGVKKKPEIIEFYNWSKAGVDTMDKLLSRYTTKRSTQRWYNILDVTCLAAYILHYENNKVLPKKSYERRLFYWQLGRELCTPFVKNRSLNPR